MTRQALGRGLKALIPQIEETHGSAVKQIPVESIEPNPYQPRSSFSEEGLQELADSIKEKGVLQPITVRAHGSGYQLVAGERRWRASKIAGLVEIPALVRELTDRQVMEIALIENLQREDLNPIEEAKAYGVLIREFQLTQEDVAQAVGKGRPTVANRLRLLRLPSEVQDWIAGGELSPGHGKILVMLGEERAIGLGRRCVEESWSVRQLEDHLASGDAKGVKKRDAVPAKATQSPFIREIEDRLRGMLGTKVKVQDKKGKGKIEVEYYSTEELNRILEVIAGGSWE